MAQQHTEQASPLRWMNNEIIDSNVVAKIHRQTNCWFNLKTYSVLQFFFSRWSSTCDLASLCHHPGAEIGYPQAYLGRNNLSSFFWQLCKKMVKFWSTFVQYLVNFCSMFGQTSGRGKGGLTTQETPWWAAHLQGYPPDHHTYHII